MQQPTQLNIFQCKAWNPSPTIHALGTKPTIDTPKLSTPNTDPYPSTPLPTETPNIPHPQETNKPETINNNNCSQPITPLPNTNYSHQSLKALTLNTRGMHTTILDLQKILDTNPDLHIIALTETKHRHIKSIWRHTLKNYKLIYKPSHYDKQTHRCSGGTILAIHKNAYPNIKPIHIPSQYQPYLAIALLTPNIGSAILAIAAYLPQHQTRKETQTHQDT